MTPPTRGNLIFGITDLVRHLGSQETFAREALLPGLAISTAAVRDGAPVVVDFVLESQSSGISVSGTVTVPWVGACRRCLRDVEGSSTAEVREVFSRTPQDDEIYPLATDHADLEPMIRDAVLLTLPLAPLCGDDCLGPAPDLFPTASIDDPAASGDPGPDRDVDERWSALDQLRFD